MTSAIIILYCFVIVGYGIAGVVIRDLLIEIKSLKEAIAKAQTNCLTLRDNDTILSNDMKALRHEFKTSKTKTVTKIVRRA